jgi:hypothetical protein
LRAKAEAGYATLSVSRYFDMISLPATKWVKLRKSIFFLSFAMSDEKEKETLWYRLWEHRSAKEKKRLKSFLPLILYTVGFLYFVIYLSILNTVNRHKGGATVKSWWGGDKPETVMMQEKAKQEIADSFKNLRKRVSGGR